MSFSVRKAGRVPPIAILIGCCVGLPAELAAQNRTSTVLVLKDPTPRQPDLEKTLNPPKRFSAPDPSVLAAYNQRRYELIRRASGQIQSLSSLLERSFQEENGKTSRQAQVQVAGVIEKLSGNICSALSTRPDQVLPGERAHEIEKTEPLTVRLGELMASAAKLNDEIEKSGPDTLPVSVLLASARVKALAHELKSRLEQK